MIEPKMLRPLVMEAVTWIWAQGRVPMVLCALPLVALPDRVARAHEAYGVVPIKLDARDPLNVLETDEGLEVDLAFSGQVVRAVLPWKQIQAVSTEEGAALYMRPFMATPAWERGVRPYASGLPVPEPVEVPVTGEPPKHSGHLRCIRGGKD